MLSANEHPSRLAVSPVENAPLDAGVTVIIPSFDRFGTAIRCVTSIVSSTPLSKGRIATVLVTSTYSEPEIASLESAGARVLRLERRVDVSAARNAGAELAATEFVLFLDDDNECATDMVRRLHEAFVRWHDISIAGPAMYYGSDPGRLWCAGVARTRLLLRTQFVTTISTPPPDRIRSEDLPNCFMVRTAAFIAAGGFDAVGFPRHMEEADFARRVTAIEGGSVYCIPAAKVWHFIDSNFARRLHVGNAASAFMVARSRSWFVARYGSRTQKWLYIGAGQWLLAGVYLAAAALQGGGDRRAVMLAYLRGLAAGLSPPPKTTAKASAKRNSERG